MMATRMQKIKTARVDENGGLRAIAYVMNFRLLVFFFFMGWYTLYVARGVFLTNAGYEILFCSLMMMKDVMECI